MSSSRNAAKRRRMRRDCTRLMIGPIIASFFVCLLTIIAPTAISIMIGDMADSLLALDTAGITKQLPAFAFALCLQVLIAPLMALIKNILLTRQGTAYDVFLMNSTLQMPYKSLHSIDSGDYIYRFEVDRTLYYLAIVELCSYPLAIVLYLVFFVFFTKQNNYNIIFCLWIFLLSALSMIYDSVIAKRQAALKKETADYEAKRTDLELETYVMRDFSIGYGLNQFLASRLHQLFARYWDETGKEHSKKNAMTSVIQFLGDYGVEAMSLLAGSVLVAQGSMEVGALLGGYLLVPTIKKCLEFVKQIIVDVQDERNYGLRMEYFYEDRELDESPATDNVSKVIRLENIHFSYPQAEAEVLTGINVTLNAEENIQFVGPNGCGKSTLLSLIGGIYIADEGSILDKDGNTISIQQLRRSIASQEQTSIVFTGTVWENLFLSEDLKDEAQNMLDEFLFEKPLDYQINGDGKNLSPGERKKVILTRALLKDAPFVVLDEPLNHLDVQSKEALIHYLQSRGGGIILVSHQEFMDGKAGFQKIAMDCGHLV